MGKVRGLNHLTLAVADIDRSIAFYRDLLGFDLRARWGEGAYLEAGSLWLCLSVDDAARTRPHPDYTHVALDVDDAAYEALSVQLAPVARLWKMNRSEGKSLYILDPDGHKLELHVGSLRTRIESYRSCPKEGRVVNELESPNV